MSRWAAILAGGSGTRFWPLSTPDHPKQFLPLAGDHPLLAEALARLPEDIPPERTLIVTGHHLAAATRALLESVPAENILAEPKPASTGPALAWATSVAHARDPEASVVSVHADWHVADPGPFRAALTHAIGAAEQHDLLITVGIVPTRPEIGYGYIVPGAPVDDVTTRVDRFTEKPDRDLAQRLIDQGALWNSGMFAWTASRFLEETERHAPEIAPALPYLETQDVAGFFAAVTPIAVDVSHFERSDRVGVVRGSFDWDDIGNWAALGRARPVDGDGNVLVGPSYGHDATDCIVWSDGHPVVVDGVSDLVVVHANGATLVTTRARAPALKDLLDALPDALRDRPTHGGREPD